MNDPTTRRGGFWGKIPARGDFVGAGLSHGFVRAWDQWMSQALADGRAALGERWDTAWLVAPVWRYAAAPGLLGPLAVAGLWMPSVDRAGRGFPLSFAMEGSGVGMDWLDVAEDLGRDALSCGLAPEQITARIAAAAPGGAPLPDAAGGSVWWTEGSPHVAAGAQHCGGLPGAAAFARMIDATAA